MSNKYQKHNKASNDELKEIIKKLNPKSILDLGCGINPLALAEKGVKYYASDINSEDLNIVREFFKNYKRIINDFRKQFTTLMDSPEFKDPIIVENDNEAMDILYTIQERCLPYARQFLEKKLKTLFSPK